MTHEDDLQFVSVIIPSYGRDAILQKCLERVLSQEYEPFEVVVVHQGEKPFSWQDEKVRIIHHEAPLGSPQAKNVGIENSRGNFLVFIDDDAYPENNQWLSQIVHPFATIPNLGAVGGRIISADRAHRNRNRVGIIIFNSLGMYKIIGNFDSQRTCDVDHLSSGNLAVTREALNKMESPYFDLAFEGGAFREETHFCVRLKGLGYRLRHLGEATVVHEAAPVGGNRKMGQLGGFWNGFGEATLFFKEFWNGRHLDLLRFVVQEGLFNWMPPRYQLAKIGGTLIGIMSNRPRRKPHEKVFKPPPEGKKIR